MDKFLFSIYLMDYADEGNLPHERKYPFWVLTSAMEESMPNI